MMDDSDDFFADVPVVKVDASLESMGFKPAPSSVCVVGFKV